MLAKFSTLVLFMKAGMFLSSPLKPYSASPSRVVLLRLPRPFQTTTPGDTEACDTLLDDRCIAHATRAATERLVISVGELNTRGTSLKMDASAYVGDTCVGDSCSVADDVAAADMRLRCRTVSRLYSTAWDCACKEGKRESLDVLVVLPELRAGAPPCPSMLPLPRAHLVMADHQHHPPSPSPSSAFESLSPIVEQHLADMNPYENGSRVVLLDDTLPAAAAATAPQSPTRIPRKSCRGSVGCLSFCRVAVGGTFDHLHAGHRKLLTAAALLTTDSILVGIVAGESGGEDEGNREHSNGGDDDRGITTRTSVGRGEEMVEGAGGGSEVASVSAPVLLQGHCRAKDGAERIEPFAARAAAVVGFLRLVAPRLNVQVVSLINSVGPAATDPHLGALLVSSETMGAARAIHEARKRARDRLLQEEQKELHSKADDSAFVPPLVPLTTLVLRRTQHAALSSTQLRQQQNQQENACNI